MKFNFLRRSGDFPSVAEFIANHQQLLKNKSNTKGLFTSDPQTLQIAQEVINFDQSRSEGLSYVLEKPSYSTNELGSVQVVLSSLDNFPQHKKTYEQQKNQEVMMCVGGPSAEDQAVIAAMIPKISQQLDKIIYVTRDYKESNVAHSAKQYHIRHANALNADPHLTGRHIIKTIFKRWLLGMKEQEITSSGFLKIDIKPTFSWKVWKIYIGNEINAIKQNLRQLVGKLTEHDINRISAFLGGEFFTAMESKLECQISGKASNADLDHPSAIHVTFSAKESAAAEVENKILSRINIRCEELNREQIDNFFGAANQIYKAYSYPSDTHVVFDIHQINKNFALKNKKVEWCEGMEVKRILLTKDESGAPKIAGVVDQNGKFIYVSKLHFSGGYKVDYLYDSNSRDKPLSNEMTTATGVSINAIFKKTKRFGEVSVTNSHWTKIAENDEYMIVRITGGGNTGSEEYNPAYALNVIANSRRIFGDALVGIISAYGCSRAVNSKNSTQWAKLAKGLVVSYGKGGTGNTKRHFEALKALHKLGFAKELRDFCNQYESARGGLLGDQIDKIMQASTQDFFRDNSKKTARCLFGS